MQELGCDYTRCLDIEVKLKQKQVESSSICHNGVVEKEKGFVRGCEFPMQDLMPSKFIFKPNI